MDAPTRRQLLAVGTLTLTSLAGCGGSGPETAGAPDTTASGGTATAAAGGVTASVSSEGFDLREANVTAVEMSASGGGTYRFAVTLYHDDAGEDGFANWWQVETLDGERLGRRELLHAHGTQPFTRSETIPVPADVDCVVVRGHDQTHGYGGQAVLVAVPGGETRAHEQGADRRSFDRSDCP